MFSKMLLLVISALLGACLADAACSSADCSPNFEPQPNINLAMIGYNILKGNPYSSEATMDLGQYEREGIFQPTIKDGDRYVLHDGITVGPIQTCKVQKQQRIMTSVQQYRDFLTQSMSQGSEMATNLEYDVSVSVPVKGAELGISTTVPPLASAAFSGNEKYQKDEQFFSRKHGRLLMIYGVCTSYSFTISRSYPPLFRKNFLRALKTLQETTQLSDGEKNRAFRTFIDQFGTHYLRSGIMGARMAVTERLEKTERMTSSDEQASKCSRESKSLFFGLIKSRSEMCENEIKQQSSQLYNEYSRFEYFSYGSALDKDPETWAKQQITKPMPIKMTLDPIVNLFRKTFMENLKDEDDQPFNFDYTAVLQWFLPRYLRYCEDNKSELNVKSCKPMDVKVKKCGLNDDCQIDQVCRDDRTRPEGYECVNPGMIFNCSRLSYLDINSFLFLSRFNVKNGPLLFLEINTIFFLRNRI